MYGGEEWNPHLLLRYGYTLDFFEALAPLRMHGIELPLALIRPYHHFIRDTVDRRRTNDAYVRERGSSWNMHSMFDVQTRLRRLPGQSGSFGAEPGRDTILLCGNYVDFALRHLTSHKVILLSHYLYERRYLKNKKLPAQFEIYRLADKLLFGTPSKRVRKETKELLRSFDRLHTAFHRQAGQHEVLARGAFRRWMHEEIPFIVELIDALHELLRTRPIKLIVEHTELPPRQSILSLLARIHGLPFLHVQHHLSSDASMVPARASHYAVWGRHMREWLIRRGIPSAAITETGSVRLELSRRPVVHTRDDLLACCGWEAGTPILVLMTEQYDASVNYNVAAWLQETVRSLPVYAIIKPHPDDRLSYDAFVSERLAIAPPFFHLDEILHAADLVLTISSTTAVEAAMAEKGVIVLQPDMAYDYHLNYNGYVRHLAKAEAGEIVTSGSVLTACLRTWLEDESFRSALLDQGRSFLRKTLTGGEPSPGGAVYELVRRLLQSSGKERVR
ncbi:hypothetical protein [Paenibacillus tyrfis]|uniref:hypothetical protein n=1 Tax=Paenibacillus tyrfis TaxID=1501230 RepID=UPI0020A077B1|nr:hypothetical protein [Paenibacillus tyrfis]MCP1306859.1 hypothetical protein [Paenibacillus tyrfis]